MKHTRASLIILTCLFLGGCSVADVKKNYDGAKDFLFETKPTASPLYDEDDTPIIGLNYDAAEEMAADMRNDIERASPIHVVPFTNLADANDRAPFGRVVADQLAARLAQMDFNVVSKIPMPDAASEDNATRKGSWSAYPVLPSVLSGTYLLGEDVIYLSAKVVSVDSGTVVTGYQWTLPINRNTRALLPQLLRPGRAIAPTVKTTGF